MLEKNLLDEKLLSQTVFLSGNFEIQPLLKGK